MVQCGSEVQVDIFLFDAIITSSRCEIPTGRIPLEDVMMRSESIFREDKQQ